MDTACSNAEAITESVRAGLEQGIFQEKYKVFCLGIKTTKDFKPRDESRFVSEFIGGSGFFLLVDKIANKKFKLSSFLNTGIIEKSRNLIFESVMTIEPSDAFPTAKSTMGMPSYFRIEEDGNIVEVTVAAIRGLVDL